MKGRVRKGHRTGNTSISGTEEEVARKEAKQIEGLRENQERISFTLWEGSTEMQLLQRLRS